MGTPKAIKGTNNGDLNGHKILEPLVNSCASLHLTCTLATNEPIPGLLKQNRVPARFMRAFEVIVHPVLDDLLEIGGANGATSFPDQMGRQAPE